MSARLSPNQLALILGFVASVGPFAIDMYLPALPQIGAALGADVAAMQTTLTSYFLAVGLAQLVYGPWADQAGRKLPLYFGLALFLVGAVACAFAPSSGWLIAARFVQGLGGAALVVIPRAVIRDLHTGTQATKLMALVMLAISVSPMLAPLAGAGLMVFGGWRAIFAVLAVAAGVSLALTAFVLPETLEGKRRADIDMRSLWTNTGVLMRDPVFVGLTLVGAFGMASFFVFIASAGFVYTDTFGLTPMGFSIAFAINALGFFAASQVAAPLGERVGLALVVRIGVVGFAAFAVMLSIVAMVGTLSLAVVVGVLFCANACLGLVIPTTMVMALDEHGESAGLASSLGGTCQMVVGGVAIMAAAPFFDGTVAPMAAAIAVCGSAALVVMLVTLPQTRATRASWRTDRSESS